MQLWAIVCLSFCAVVYAVSACSCRASTQQEIWDQSEIVAKMNIVSKEENGTELKYTANYLQIYKPADQSHIFIPVPIVTGASSAACGVTELVIGEDYLITGTWQDSNIAISSCNGMPTDDGEFSSPPGALAWQYVSPKLEAKLECGSFEKSAPKKCRKNQ